MGITAGDIVRDSGSLDHWPAIEIDTLKDDLQTAESEILRLVYTLDTVQHKLDKKRKEYTQIRNSIDKQVVEKAEILNEDLRDKAMIYLSLINEYEAVFDAHGIDPNRMGRSSIIKNLRRRGGLIT